MLGYRFFNCLLAIPQNTLRFCFARNTRETANAMRNFNRTNSSFFRPKVTLWSCYSLQKVFLKAHKILNAVLGELWRDECRVIWETLRKRILLISEKNY